MGYMKDNLIKKIDEFLNGNIDLWDLIGEITYFSTTDFKSFSESIYYMEPKEDENSLIVEVLLWCFVNSPIKDLKETNNSFYKFLMSLVESNSSFYLDEIKWIFNDNYISIFKKHDYLLVINASNNDKYINLPTEYTNCTLYCSNCNEEINVKDNLLVPSKTFYIIEKEN